MLSLYNNGLHLMIFLENANANSDQAQQNFWPIFMAVAATLAGFTLVGFSIFISRAERASTDKVCRRYCFREISSNDSWAFVFFTLFMFLAPILLGLLTLIPIDTANGFFSNAFAVLLVGVAIIFCILFIIYIIYKQVTYMQRVAKHNRAVDNFNRSEKRSFSRSKEDAPSEDVLSKEEASTAFVAVLDFLFVIILLRSLFNIVIAGLFFLALIFLLRHSLYQFYQGFKYKELISLCLATGLLVFA